jgi:hypothetical protein
MSGKGVTVESRDNVAGRFSWLASFVQVGFLRS